MAVRVSPGNFPFFLMGTKAAPSRSAMMGPIKKPLASRPTTTSTLLWLFLLLNDDDDDDTSTGEGMEGIVCDVI